jgi:invasion protein IalB
LLGNTVLGRPPGKGLAIAGAIFVSGLLLGWLASHFWSAERDVPTIAFYDDWRVACPAASRKNHTCEIARTVIDGKSRAQLAALTLAGSALVVTVPYDVRIAQGIGLALGDDKPRIYPYATCNEAGCLAQLPVDDALRAAMRREPQARLIFVDMNQQAVEVSFALRGFRRADDAARRSESLLQWLVHPA